MGVTASRQQALAAAVAVQYCALLVHRSSVISVEGGELQFTCAHSKSQARC
jgi:hypothetical protein